MAVTPIQAQQQQQHQVPHLAGDLMLQSRGHSPIFRQNNIEYLDLTSDPYGPMSGPPPPAPLPPHLRARPPGSLNNIPDAGQLSRFRDANRISEIPIKCLMADIKGLVKGAELCLNPYFFGWL